MIPATDEKDRIRQILHAANKSEFWTTFYHKGEALPFSSIIEREDVPDFVLLGWFADTFGQNYLRNEIEDELALRVSINGIGRSQGTKATVMFESQVPKEPDAKRSFLRRFMPRRNRNE